MSNILQIKDRGATVIVFTTFKGLKEAIDMTKIDHLIELFPCESLLAGLLAVPPLLMICYLTAVAKGINPDENISEAINLKALDR